MCQAVPAWVPSRTVPSRWGVLHPRKTMAGIHRMCKVYVQGADALGPAQHGAPNLMVIFAAGASPAGFLVSGGLHLFTSKQAHAA